MGRRDRRSAPTTSAACCARPSSRTARASAARGEIDRAALRAVEDRAIREAVTLQEVVGLQSITDGEFRRDWWHIDFLPASTAWSYREASASACSSRAPTSKPPTHEGDRQAAAHQAQHARSFPVSEVGDHAHAEVHACRRRPCCTRAATGSIAQDLPGLEAEFWADLTRCYREEIARPVPGRLPLPADRRHHHRHVRRSEGAGAVREARRRSEEGRRRSTPQAVNAAIRDVPDDMTVAIHTCRGNFKSTWLASGGYDYVAETAFSTLDVDGVLPRVRRPTARAASSRCATCPKGKKVVLGLVSSKIPDARDEGRPQAPHRVGREVRAARKPLPQPAVRLLQHAPRQQGHRGRSEAQAGAGARGRA